MSSNLQILKNLIRTKSTTYRQKVDNEVDSVPDQILMVVIDNDEVSVTSTSYTGTGLGTVIQLDLSPGSTYEIISNIRIESNIVNNKNGLRILDVTNTPVILAQHTVLFWVSEELNYDVTDVFRITPTTDQLLLDIDMFVQATAVLTKKTWEVIVKTVDWLSKNSEIFAFFIINIKEIYYIMKWLFREAIALYNISYNFLLDIKSYVLYENQGGTCVSNKKLQKYWVFK